MTNTNIIDDKIESIKNALADDACNWMEQSYKDMLLEKWSDNLKLSIPNDRVLEQMNDFINS